MNLLHFQNLLTHRDGLICLISEKFLRKAYHFSFSSSASSASHSIINCQRFCKNLFARITTGDKSPKGTNKHTISVRTEIFIEVSEP